MTHLKKTTTTYTIPAADLTALLLATEEAVRAAEAEHNRLAGQNAYNQGRRVDDPYIRLEIERLRAVITNANQAIERIRRIQDQQREAA